MTTASNKGMALIAVLWIVSLLALMAAGIGSSGRTVTKLAFNTVENTKARLSADGGIQHAIFDLLTADEDRPWQAGGMLNHVVNFNQARVQIQVRDEDGKIDINTATLELLKGVFLAVGLEEDQAVGLAAGMIDFRDNDSNLSPSGAEDPEYEAAARPGGAADRPFRNIAELGDVLGVSEAIYEQAHPHFTIYSDAEGVDPFRASRGVLKALPGMTPEILEAILSLSGESSEDDPLLALPEELASPFEDYLLPSRGLVFEIRAFGESEGGGRFAREAIVALGGDQDDLPFTVYDWRRGNF